MNDLVSIIVPTYNSSKWIVRCLDSVVSATDTMCEIIVVDDGSTDKTMSIVESYANNHLDVSIRIIAIDHRGPLAARHVGVCAAMGKWIAFVDSDDIIINDSLSKMRKLVDDETDIVCANIIVKSSSEANSLILRGGQCSGRDFAIKVLNNDIIGVLVAKLFRRSLFNAIEWDDDGVMTNHEDAMLLLKLATAASGKVKVDPLIHAYVYYKRAGSQSSMLKMSLEGLERIWHNVKELDLPKDALTRWGLSLIYQTFISRGVVFENNYGPAVDLRRMSRNVKLEKMYRLTAWMLYSKWLRRYVMRRHVRDGLLTTTVPDLAFILYCHNDLLGVKRTVKSIFDTGLRNIEILIINDASDQKISVGLNILQNKYRRIKVLGNTMRLGCQASQYKAVKISQSFAVLFVCLGDKVSRDSVYDALVKINNGADMALVDAADRSLLNGVKTLCGADVNLHVEESDWLSKVTHGDFSAVPPLYGMMFKREIITDGEGVNDADET